MEVEIKAEAKRRKLNNAVAMTVEALSVLMAVSKIKDDNIVQAMQAAKADMVDSWNEYQAERMKLHLSEQTKALYLAEHSQADVNSANELIASLDGKIEKYNTASAALSKQAKDLQTSYDSLNFRDDQFDVADAACAIALSLAAVTVLTGLWWLLFVSWGFGLSGLTLTIAAFNAWPIHPDILVNFLN
jgi:ribosome-binding ATPase YchF (GTP1/OBG family)